jgi:hypothetical protein
MEPDKEGPYKALIKALKGLIYVWSVRIRILLTRPLKGLLKAFKQSLKGLQKAF